jgi:DNA polymerase-3 subunit alpha
MYLIFDTETTGLPKNFNAPLTDSDNWPRMVQIAWQLHDSDGNLLENKDYIIKPEGYDIPYNAVRIHGISTKMAQEEGHDLDEILEKFSQVLAKTKVGVGHNIEFDYNIVGAEFLRKNKTNSLENVANADTMKLVAGIISNQ